MMAGDHKFQLIFVWIPGVKEIYFSFPFQIFFKTVYSLLKHLFISAHPQIMHFGVLLAVHLILIIMPKRWCCFIRYPLVTNRPLGFLSGIPALLRMTSHLNMLNGLSSHTGVPVNHDL